MQRIARLTNNRKSVLDWDSRNDNPLVFFTWLRASPENGDKGSDFGGQQ